MSLSLAAEAWTLSVLGWVWLTIQNLWLPSLLCSHVYYGFLLLSTCHLITVSLVPDGRAPRVAYFNTVLGLCVFYGCSIMDCLDTYTFGGTTFRPPKSNPGDCCANCDIARANQVLFFADTPLFLAQAGTLVGYLAVHLLLAGVQQLDAAHRTVWSGASWTWTLGMMLAVRFVITFDGSTLTLVPESVFYLRLFSQPLMDLSAICWVLLLAFLVFAGCEGLPRTRIKGADGVERIDLGPFRIIRCMGLGVILAFVIGGCVVFGDRGMLTTPLFLAFLILFLGGVGGVLEAFLGREEEPNASPVSSARPLARHAPPPQAQRSRAPFAPAPTPGGKKGA